MAQPESQDGGVLVTGRNRGRETPQIPTTVFARRGSRLLPVRDLMGGSEQKDLALSVRLAKAPPPSS
jgi:hypothetical protein